MTKNTYRTIYYKVVIEWCKYPFHQEIERKYVEFSYTKKKFRPIEGLEMDSDTSIEEKTAYLRGKLKIHPIKVEKIK